MPPTEDHPTAERLTQYWIEVDLSTTVLQGYASSHGVGLGCGVTAHGHDDALHLLRLMIFRDGPVLPVRRIVEDIDISALDSVLVQPRVTDPAPRGVWFPPLTSEPPA